MNMTRHEVRVCLYTESHRAMHYGSAHAAASHETWGIACEGWDMKAERSACANQAPHHPRNRANPCGRASLSSSLDPRRRDLLPATQCAPPNNDCRPAAEVPRRCTREGARCGPGRPTCPRAIQPSNDAIIRAEHTRTASSGGTYHKLCGHCKCLSSSSVGAWPWPSSRASCASRWHGRYSRS